MLFNLYTRHALKSSKITDVITWFKERLELTEYFVAYETSEVNLYENGDFKIRFENILCQHPDLEEPPQVFSGVTVTKNSQHKYETSSASFHIEIENVSSETIESMTRRSFCEPPPSKKIKLS